MADLRTVLPASNPQKIVLERVSKVFGMFAALRNVSIELDCGRIYVILGENGAGKSTLLRVLAGLTPPTTGTIRWPDNGPNQSSNRVSQARIGYMAHASMLYDELSAMENLQYFEGLYAREKGLGSTAIAKTWTGAENALPAMGLDPKLKRPVGQYSQGMRQRVSLARAIQHDPEFVLLDEPFSNVDAESARRMIALITAMRDAQRTVILTTHQPALVEHAADEFLTMAAGEIAGRRPAGRALESQTGMRT